MPAPQVEPLPKKEESLKYKPSCDSLQARELPGWYDGAKVGIFVHWGIYSVPSFVDAHTDGLLSHLIKQIGESCMNL